ncbi:MAG: SIR2 family protein [Balneola sp.]|jgi:hypothetical protein
MQYFEDAPNLPDELLEAQEENKLVFICGAGISKNTGLELFEGLTKQVIEDLGGTLESEEEMLMEVNSYDKVFSLLERDERFGFEQVRESVKKNLATPSKPNLEVHKSILKLSKNRENELKLITTNFDVLFEEADDTIKSYKAPLLPIPKPERWSGLVHLHGCIEDDLKNLVLSSSDFGIAYLTERWASRFITELFQHYTVVFIGYSVDDPVMKYLIDAIAAERKRDSRIGGAYAFVASNKIENDQIESQWKTKNIIPIIYRSYDNDHSLLNKTLSAWAKSWTGGLESKHNIVSKIGKNNPTSIPQNEVEKLIWAISSDKSGSTARTFAKLGKKAPIEWLTIFDKENLLSIQDEESGLKSELVDRSFYDHSTPTLSTVQRELMDWITCHLDEMILVEWVIDKGSILHPALRWRIQYKLYRVELSKGFNKFWKVLTNHVLSNKTGYFYRDIEFFNQKYTPLFKQAILSLFTPLIIPKKSYNFSLFKLEESNTEVNYEELSDVASFELMSKFEYFNHNISSLKKREDWRELNKDILFDLLEKLKNTLELYSIIDKATEYDDPTYFQRQSIERHDQNHNHSFESQLIELVSDGIEFLTEDNDDLDSLIQYVFRIEYPVFRRISYFISRKDTPKAKRLLFSKIIKYPNKWLWDYELRIEQFKTLPILWNSLNRREKDKLEQLILLGGDKTIFKSTITDQEFTEAKESNTWKLLSIINHNSDDLRLRSKKILQNLNKKHNWVFTGNERENFGVWSYGASWVAEPLAKEDLNEISISETAKLLTDIESEKFEGRVNSLRELSSKNPTRASDILIKFNSIYGFNKSILEAYFYGYSPKVDPGSKIYKLISNLNQKQVNESLHSLTRFLSEAAKKVTSENRKDFFNAWDNVIEESLIESESSFLPGDKFNAAYNHPLGSLTITLFNYLVQEKHPQNGELPKVIKKRMIKILTQDNDEIKNSITIITSRLGFLEYVDPLFTENHIYKFFDFKNKYAIWAWEGYLWNPYIDPPIYKNIKDQYAVAITKKKDFSREANRNLPLIIPAISIDIPDLMSFESSRELMNKLDSEDLSRIVRWLIQKIESNTDKAEEMWSNIICPWLKNSWPKKRSIRDENLSSELLELILLDKNIFKSAFDTLYEFLTPIRRTYSSFSNLIEKEIIKEFPLESLFLINAVIPDMPDWYSGFNELKNLLETISKADEKLKTKKEFIRLKEIELRIRK